MRGNMNVKYLIHAQNLLYSKFRRLPFISIQAPQRLNLTIEKTVQVVSFQSYSKVDTENEVSVAGH
jgi:hypothetical protein